MYIDIKSFVPIDGTVNRHASHNRVVKQSLWERAEEFNEHRNTFDVKKN